MPAFIPVVLFWRMSCVDIQNLFLKLYINISQAKFTMFYDPLHVEKHTHDFRCSWSDNLSICSFHTELCMTRPIWSLNNSQWTIFYFCWFTSFRIWLIYTFRKKRFSNYFQTENCKNLSSKMNIEWNSLKWLIRS